MLFRSLPSPARDLLVARAIGIDRAVETLVETESLVVALASDPHRGEADTESSTPIVTVDTVDIESDPVETIGEEHLRRNPTDIG